MSTQSHSGGPTPSPNHAHEHQPPSPKVFITVGGILAVLTLIEYLIISITGMRSLIVVVLFVLSLVKFLMVVSYFMHLRFELRILSWIFAIGFLLAIAITTAMKFVNMA